MWSQLLVLVSSASVVPMVPVVLARAPEVPAFALEIAKKEVLAIYERSGVSITWSGDEQPAAYPRVVVLFRRAESFPLGTDDRALGLALLSSGTGAPPTRVLVVFSDRLDRLVSCDCPVKLGRALGRAIAHEVGHSLKYEARHSDTGLMRADIPQPRWLAPHRHDFYIAAADAEAIHARLGR
jgi:hypothetical protein